MGQKLPETAIENLFEEHYRALVATAYVIIPDRGLAEEISQEAFARLIDRWDRLQHYEAPGAWLRLVTVRLASRAKRRRWREVVVTTRSERAAPDRPSTIGGEVTEAMSSLSSLDRQTVAMHYFADLSIDQIAKELGMAESTVRVHLHRGRNGIKAHLAPTDSTARVDDPHNSRPTSVTKEKKQ